jgi:predicted acetyltransferase
MQPALELCQLAPDDVRGYSEAVERGFHVAYIPEVASVWERQFEPDRFFGFRAADRWVATCGAFSRRITVPGGQAVPVAAVTLVTVAPAFRRQGLLRQMMTRQLHDGRFGYGQAAPRWALTADTRDLTFEPDTDLGRGRADEVDQQEFLATAGPLRERLLPSMVGALDRPGDWWQVSLIDHAVHRAGAGPQRYLLHHNESGEVDGYATFRVAEEFTPTGPNSELRVGELLTGTAAARARLWRLLLDLDLVRRMKMTNAPVAEPLRRWVTSPASIDTALRDSLYLRIVDVEAALRARCYPVDIDVVIDVDDPLLPANRGRFRLTGGRDGADVRRVQTTPDLSLSVRHLASVLLGGVALTEYAATGQVGGDDPDLVYRVGAAFGSDRPPHCPDQF